MKHQTFVLLLTLPVIAMAQGTSTGGTFLKVPSHAVGAAMGDAAVVDAANLGAIGLNPANLFSSSERTSVTLTHAQWIQDISGQRLNLAFPLPLGRFSFGVATTRIADVEVREQPGPAVGTFDAQSATFSGAWAVEISNGITAGIAASYLYEKIYVDESSGFAVDMGALAETPLDGMTVGLALSNLGKLSAFRTEAVDLPTTLRFGASYRTVAGDFTVVPAIAARQEFKGSGFGLTAGASVLYKDAIGLRASWRSGETARSLGLGFVAGYAGLGFNYSIVPFSSGLGSAHVLTLSVEF